MKYSELVKAKVSPCMKDKLEDIAKGLEVTTSEALRQLILAADETLLAYYSARAKHYKARIVQH